MPALYSQMSRPFWQALASFPAIGCAALLPSHWFIFSALHKPIAVQLHALLKKKGFSIGEKGVSPSVLNKTQYSFRISRNRGYVSNRVRLSPSRKLIFAYRSACLQRLLENRLYFCNSAMWY